MILCFICKSLSYIGDNFWDITQTILWVVWLTFAYIAWWQYKEDKKIEYRKLDYQINKDIYDMYCNNPYIDILIKSKDKESESIPATKEKLQKSMINSLHKLHSLLVPYAYKGVKFSNKPSPKN